MPLYIQFGVLDINECSRRLERECIRDPSCVRYLSLGWYLFMNRQRPCQFMKHWPGFTNPSQSIRYPLLHPIALHWLDNWYLSSLLTRSPSPMFLINWVRTTRDHLYIPPCQCRRSIWFVLISIFRPPYLVVNPRSNMMPECMTNISWLLSSKDIGQSWDSGDQWCSTSSYWGLSGRDRLSKCKLGRISYRCHCRKKNTNHELSKKIKWV